MRLHLPAMPNYFFVAQPAADSALVFARSRRARAVSVSLQIFQNCVLLATVIIPAAIGNIFRKFRKHFGREASFRNFCSDVSDPGESGQSAAGRNVPFPP